eukprot:gene44382-55193_t
MHNTIEATKVGLVERARQGLYFCTTKNNSSLAVIEEKVSLQDSYSEKQSVKTMLSAFETMQKEFATLTTNSASGVNSQMSSLLKQLDDFAIEYGSDVNVIGNSNENEVEKQQEQEKELERQVQQPKYNPANEVDWIYHFVFSGILPSGVVTLQQMVESYTSSDLGLMSIQWNSVASQIDCTPNFVKTVLSDGLHKQSDYLRIVEVCLYFTASKRVLLVSEREADAILTLMPSHRDQNSVQFIHLSDLLKEYNTVNALSHNNIVTTANTQVSPLTAFLLMLFNGETNFPPNSKCASAMTATLKGKRAAQSAALKIPPLRGKSHLLKMSDLEATCKELM